jgi:hypothetical protein
VTITDSVQLRATHCGKDAAARVDMDIATDPRDPHASVRGADIITLRDDAEGVTRRIVFECSVCREQVPGNLHKVRALLWQIRAHYVSTGTGRVVRLTFDELRSELTRAEPLA